MKNMKTIVRATVIIPDSYVSIQRLYDDGKFFRLERETKAGHEAADFIERLRVNGGKLIDCHKFLDEDDFKEKLSATFEYVSK